MTQADERTAGEHALDRRVLWIWRARAAALFVTAAAAVGVVGATAVANGADGALVVALAAVAVAACGAAAVVWPQLAFDRWRYVVGDDALELRHGVVYRTRSWVPWFRIQHVDVEQGPVERRLGLVRLVLRTASASTDAEIPGVPAAHGDDLRRLILERVGRGDAV